MISTSSTAITTSQIRDRPDKSTSKRGHTHRRDRTRAGAICTAVASHNKQARKRIEATNAGHGECKPVIARRGAKLGQA